MPDNLTAALDEIRTRSGAHIINVATLPIASDDVRTLLETAGDVPRLLAAIDAVLAQHAVLHDSGGAPVCPSCSMQMGERVNPDRCFVRTAISRALLGEDGTDG